MQDNLNYFKYSRDNPEQLFDGNYIFDELEPKLDDFIKKTVKIKEILTAIKVAFESGHSEDTIERFFATLYEAIQVDSNKSEFICFANACDTPLAILKKQENIWLLKEITKHYLKKRTITEATPKEWIQALCDSQASRKKGKAGEKKLIQICNDDGFVLVTQWEQFQQYNRAVAKFSKGQINLDIVRRELNIPFAANNQSKLPDLLIKRDDRWVILEAKHQTVGGGGQNNKMTELVNLLSMNEANLNIKFVAFLDGDYSNPLLNLTDGQIEQREPVNSDNKYASQQKDIIRLLHLNANNYWLNTAGFIKFIREI